MIITDSSFSLGFIVFFLKKKLPSVSNRQPHFGGLKWMRLKVKASALLIFKSLFYLSWHAVSVNGHHARSICLFFALSIPNRMCLPDLLCQRVRLEGPKCPARAEDFARGEWLLDLYYVSIDD